MTSDKMEEAQRSLMRIWIDFESGLRQVPLIRRLLAGLLKTEDYRALLLNLRQQVVEGSRWISRAASSFDASHSELRSMFISHAQAEHRDYLLLENNFVAAGGTLEEIRTYPKNIGSEALNAWMFHAASQSNPVGLLGAMFIIENLGQRIAGPWAQQVRSQTGLPDDAFTFFSYHAENDEEHMREFENALSLVVSVDGAVAEIARHARVTARLYRLQLEEIEHV